MAKSTSLANAVMGQLVPETTEEPAEVTPAPAKPAKKTTPSRTVKHTAAKPAARKTSSRNAPAKPAASPEPQVSQLAVLAEDPVAFIEALPAVKRGSARKAVNTDLPGELGDWMVAWCAANDISQRDLFRGLLTAMRSDAEEGR